MGTLISSFSDKVSESGHLSTEPKQHHTDDQKDLKSAILLSDSNEPDLFVSTLREAYERELSDMLKDFPALPFRGSTLDEAPRAGLFDRITLSNLHRRPRHGRLRRTYPGPAQVHRLALRTGVPKQPADRGLLLDCSPA
ncbi:hypothetical protein [Nocardiopsis rhodophaea]|uniref:hypothetical protein n=1 Tax=Nocardiopsis rhodophaea TaxID=280238 RepID=UPI00338B71BA